MARPARLAERLLVLILPFLLAGDPATGAWKVQHISYRVVAVLPHDPEAYTEGLLWHDGSLYESTGLIGASSLRQVDPATGRVRRQVRLPPPYFGEGLALWEGRLFQLTWRDHRILTWGLDCFCEQASTYLPDEGWGLTSDGQRLYASDGSDRLHVLDPRTLRQIGTIQVGSPGTSISSLNELEWTPQGIYANVWPSDTAVRIDPRTGAITGKLDLRPLGDAADRAGQDNVPNGIAYVPTTGHLLVTGKRWRHLYELALS